MIKISPSILSADFAYLARDIQAISTADYVHVDVMDGLFVSNISIGIPVVKCIRPVTDLPLDVHLMIQEPVRYVDQFCDAGADIVTCHVEADTQENILAAIEAKRLTAEQSLTAATNSANASVATTIAQMLAVAEALRDTPLPSPGYQLFFAHFAR